MVFCSSASTIATSRSYSTGDSGDHLRPKTLIGSGAAVEVSCVLLIDSVNFEGEQRPCTHLYFTLYGDLEIHLHCIWGGKTVRQILCELLTKFCLNY